LLLPKRTGAERKDKVGYTARIHTIAKLCVYKEILRQLVGDPMRIVNLMVLTSALIAMLVTSSGYAQDVTALGRHGDWIAYTYQENGQPVCYMTSAPTKSEGDYTRRGDVQMLITHRPGREAFDVISIVAGYEYMRDGEVTVSVGGVNFELFTNGDRAWARDSEADQEMTQAMIKGYTATVSGRSARGTLTTDTFSLVGFTAAHDAIDSACNAS